MTRAFEFHSEARKASMYDDSEFLCWRLGTICWLPLPISMCVCVLHIATMQTVLNIWKRNEFSHFVHDFILLRANAFVARHSLRVSSSFAQERTAEFKCWVNFNFLTQNRLPFCAPFFLIFFLSDLVSCSASMFNLFQHYECRLSETDYRSLVRSYFHIQWNSNA